MAIFAIIRQPAADMGALGKAVQATYPKAHYVLSDSAWLVAAQGTAVDVSAKLGIGVSDSKVTGIVIEAGSYYGRANPAIWTWIKTNWEASSG